MDSRAGIGPGHQCIPVGCKHRWKQRCSSAGVHLYDRVTGLNILLDEVSVPSAIHARAPRNVSIGLTNRCDLSCVHCFAPKSPDELAFELIAQWLHDLDRHGTLGVGFGGGEPTLFPDFVSICQYAARETCLSVSFTTHAHHVDKKMAEELCGSVNFIRVSMDGVGATYESIRRRSFATLLERLGNVRSVSHFGVNVVVNERTLPELDEISRVSADAGACEILLLPQMPIRDVPSVSVGGLTKLRQWVDCYKGPLKICISESSADGFPINDPLSEERGLRAYAHIDAKGVLKPTSFSDVGVPIKDIGILQALDQLTCVLKEKAK